MNMRNMIFLVTLLLLGACAGQGGTVSNDIAFEGHSQNALVILGLNNTKAKDRFRKPQLNIRRFDANSMAAGTFIKHVYVPTGPAALGVDFDKEDRTPFYAFELPPGHYLIESMYRTFVRRLNTFRQTQYATTTLLDSGAPTFKAKRGVVSYLGQINYKEHDDGSITVQTHQLNPAEGAKIIAQFPGINAPVENVQPAALEFTCDTSRRVFQREYFCNPKTMRLKYK